MHSACPDCGDIMNANLRQGDTFGAQPEEAFRRPNFLYQCRNPHCGKTAIRPERVYDDQLEWFVDVVVWRAMKVFGLFVLILFVLQILGIL